MSTHYVLETGKEGIFLHKPGEGEEKKRERIRARWKKELTNKGPSVPPTFSPASSGDFCMSSFKSNGRNPVLESESIFFRPLSLCCHTGSVPFQIKRERKRAEG